MTSNHLDDDEPGQPRPESGSTEDSTEDLAAAEHQPARDDGTDEDSTADKEKPLPDFLVLVIWFEGGLIVLALILGWFGFYDTTQSLTDFDSASRLQPAFLWGIIATLPMLVLLLATLRSDFDVFKSLRKTIEEHVYPMTRKLTLWKIVVISVLAGLGEELLFRWSLQGGLSEYFTFEYGPHLAALLVGILFGICHFITPAYGLFATVIGIYLGLVMIWSGTYLAPALAHAFYDFVALLVIVKQARVKENEENGQ